MTQSGSVFSSDPANADPANADPANGLAQQPSEAFRHLKQALLQGEPWHQALLETMGLWTLPREIHQERTYQYLIGGEAFDWLLLAERLCPEMEPAISTDEKERLLFHGRLPESVTPEIFKDLLGVNKYRGYLNYWYGVVVEEALQLAVEEEVRKRQIARCYPDSEDLVEDAYGHIYGESRLSLLEEFRKNTNIPMRRALSLTDIKEFTYWLHKRRLNMWDPARVASDTTKGTRRLSLLEQQSEGGQNANLIYAEAMAGQS
ncbi:MAG: hypothetical protein BZY88_12565 [SAR202 cluster bacterium Io17-Chloro-G9]|nr:MAG: hypothetical protein BZY88_12565 [SAR202 cluster bacterium Io17-Chloro-G9]